MATDFKSVISSFLAGIFDFFSPPLCLQIGALCFRDTPKGREILLITSRRGKRWILPKGNPIKGLSNAQTALQEAFEEAGVRGNISKEPIGKVRTAKNNGNGFRIKIDLIIYELEVSVQESIFPEKGQRKVMWLPIQEAIELCDEDSISFLLESWAQKSH